MNTVPSTAVQFKNVSKALGEKPLIVSSAIPFGCIDVFVALYVTGQPSASSHFWESPV
jgi:hypothetical protein